MSLWDVEIASLRPTGNPGSGSPPACCFRSGTDCPPSTCGCAGSQPRRRRGIDRVRARRRAGARRAGCFRPRRQFLNNRCGSLRCSGIHIRSGIKKAPDLRIMQEALQARESRAMSTAQTVRSGVRKLPKGRPFTSAHCLKHGTRGAVDRRSSRLVGRGEIQRLARGVFVRKGQTSSSAPSFPMFRKWFRPLPARMARRSRSTAPRPPGGSSSPPRCGSARVPYQRLKPHDPDWQHYRQDGLHLELPPAAVCR